MKIETMQRDPEQRKGYINESNNPFYEPQTVLTENGFDIYTEQEGKRGVSVRISIDHQEIYGLLIKMCDANPEKLSHIIKSLGGYLQHKEHHAKASGNTP
jgi:hypothetical protein